MSNARGDEARLLARRQSEFGVPEAAADGAFYALPFYSANAVPSEELAEDEAIRGDAFPGDTVAGLRNLAGALAVPMGFNSIGWHLAGLLGAPVTTEGAEGRFTHVFVTAAQPEVVLSTLGISHTRIGHHFVQDSIAYTGMEVQARKNGERARATFNVIGREETPGPATLDAAPLRFEPDPVPVGFSGRCLFDGAEVAAVTGVNLTLNSGVEADQETMNGLATAAQMDWGRWDLTGSLDARFRDRGHYDRANTGATFDLALSWQMGADYALEIVAHRIRLERTGIPVDGRGIVSSSFSWRATRPAEGDTLLTATLRNLAASYANPE